MTNYEAAHETESDGGMWLVRLPNGGGVRAVTLEQLDNAYQRDFINGDTEVLEEGTSEWKKLRDLIGDEAPAPAPVPVSHVTSANPASQARYSQQQSQPGYGGTQSPPVAPIAVRSTYPSQGYPPPPAPSPNSTYSPQGYPPPPAITAARPPAPPATPFQPNSTAPVASNIYDLDLDLLDSPFKRKSRRGLVVVAALLVAGGVAAAVVSSQSSSVAAASPEPTKAQLSLPIAKALPSEPEVVEKPKPAAESRLNDDTKKALADADKKREKTKSTKRAARGKVAAAGKRARSGERVFTKGGDSHDPLNGSL
ncbi:MAG TPA: hypothetical protein VKP30_16545 [Polyangiaceae bacterium]|nr:hypothetical protein [Polyangiaceae bacterium]